MTTMATTYDQDRSSVAGFLRHLRWDTSRALIITRREVVDMFRDWRIIFPILILTIIFPFIANAGAVRMFNYLEQFGADIIGDRLIPFLLLVVGFFPTSFSLIIALESFVGEKERASLEPLLASPLTNSQLYLGKMLSSVMPPLVGSLVGISVYLGSLYLNIQWLPPVQLLILVLALTLMQAVVMVAGAVVVSSQTTSVRAANLLASFIIIPMAFLIQAEAFVMFWANYTVLWYFLIAMLLIAGLLIRMGIQVFNREELLGREIDELNLGKILKNLFQNAVSGRETESRRSMSVWYRDEVIRPIRMLWKEILVITIAMIASFFVGKYFISLYPIPTGLVSTDEFATAFNQALSSQGLVGLNGVLKVMFQNIRALALASASGVFSFGVLTIIVLMIPLGIIGYLAPQMVLLGFDPLAPWLALVPHSVFEIPAVILAGAVALKIGTSIIAPPPGHTVSQSWLAAMGLAIRLWFAIILPLLVIAAAVEVFITPTLVLQVF